MKTIIILVSLLALSGCATIHDYCVSHAEHYGSYDECYGERQQRGQALSRALKSMGDGLQNTNRNMVTCTTIGNQTRCS